MTGSLREEPASVLEWTVAGLLALNVVYTTVMLGGYRPETQVWSWLLTTAAFSGALVLNGFGPHRLHPATWLVVPFVIYAGINAWLISPVPWLAKREWLGWAQIALMFASTLNGVRGRGPRRLVLYAIIAAGVVSVVLAGYQRFLWPDWLPMDRKQSPQFIGRASGPFGIPNSLAALLLLLIPPMLALALQRGATAVQRILCGYFAVLFLFGLALTISRGGWLALLGALLVWPLFVREKSLEWRVAVSVTAAAIAIVAGLAVYATVPRVKNRFDMLVREMGERSRPILWRASWNLFKDAPVVGTGAASYNVLFERHRPHGFRDNPQWAHNEYLNTLSDYGLAGFSLGLGAVAVGTAGCWRRRESPGRAHLAGIEGEGVTRAVGIGLFAFALSMLTDFHLKIPALAMISAALAADYILRRWPSPGSEEPGPIRQSGAIVGLLGVAGLALALALPTHRAEALRYAARERVDQLARRGTSDTQIQQTALNVAARQLAEALILDESNAQAWADRAYVSALWSRLARSRSTELGRDAETFARRALEFSDVVPEFWVRLGVGLDLQQRWSEGTAPFARAIQLAPANATFWYYYGYHLSLTPSTRALAQSALRTALRLDPEHQSATLLQESLSRPQ